MTEEYLSKLSFDQLIEVLVQYTEELLALDAMYRNEGKRESFNAKLKQIEMILKFIAVKRSGK